MWENIKLCAIVIGYCMLVFGTILTLGAILSFAFIYIKTYLEGIIFGVISICIAGLVIHLASERG